MRFGKIETRYGIIFRDGTELLSADIPYLNANYPDLDTMRQALDYLLDGDLVLTLDPIPPVELGQGVPYVDLSWSVTGGPDTQVLQGYGEIDNTLRAYRVMGPFTRDTTFTLQVSKHEQQVSASSTLKFMNRLYWGPYPDPTITSLAVQGLDNRPSLDKDLMVSMDGGGRYLYLAWPKRLGDINVKVNSIVSTAWVLSEVSVTNPYGYMEDYYIYRSEYRQNGTGILLEVSEV